MYNEIKIKDFYGRIIGTIVEKPNGDKVAKDFYGRILGDYCASTGVTRDFYGRIIGRGDLTSGLIMTNNNK